MLLPVARFDRCIGYRVSAVDHHAASDIDSDVRSAACVVGALEEDQISGLGLRLADNIAVAHQTICSRTTNIPTIAGVVDDPGYKTGTVEAGAWTGAAPDVRLDK